MCYWYEGRVDSAPPEPPRIRQARARLIAALDSAAAALPADDWIAGQRVRYLLEDSQPQAARLIAEQCRAARWWCDALGGLVGHVTGDFNGADSSFAAALAAMPDDERCRWTDISSLLEGELAKRYHHLDCGERATLAARWWWLAQPLWSLPGNDRRTEHFARVAMARIEEGRRTAFGLYWADDLREVLLRYGWPAFWTREPQDLMVPSEEPKITGHDRSPAFHFAPGVRALDRPEGARPDDWSTDQPGARERYAPAYATAFTYLDHQMAVFPRDDSCTVVAAYDLSRDTLWAHERARAALVLARNERDLVISDHDARLEGRDVLAATAPCSHQLLSLEIVSPARRAVARARYGIALDGHPAMSDLLLLDGSDSLPIDLATAMPHALASTRVRADQPLGLFWEVYGLSPDGEEVTTSVTVTRRGTGWLRRVVESVGLAAHRREVSLEWPEMLVPRVDHPGIAARALALDLSSISPGPYRIEVTVRARGRASVAARREIELVQP
jgi:hypothetical protein